MRTRLSGWLVWMALGFAVLLAVAGAGIETKFRLREEVNIRVPLDEGYLRGKVCKPKGWMPFTLPGITGAKVCLNTGVYATETDGDGFFIIPEVVPGVYNVTISASGYETAMIDAVAVAAGRITTLSDEALFPLIEGPPRARLKLGSPVPFKKIPNTYPYRTTVYLDAGGSENISRYGIRWEVRDPAGELLLDPTSKGSRTLQLERSPIPGTPPTMFLFKPPEPGDFSVTLLLTNDRYPEVTESASVIVRAVNTTPEAIPRIIPGPAPPQKQPDGTLSVSSGLTVVRKGAPVYLLGLGLDRTHSSPELYNSDGIEPDVYGKNHDWWQRQFGFSWCLTYRGREQDAGIDLSTGLVDREGMPGRTGQLVSFVADRPGLYEASLVVQDRDPSGSLASEPSSITVLCVEEEDEPDISDCEACHPGQVRTYMASAHGDNEVECQGCHGPALAHLTIREPAFLEHEVYKRQKRETQDVSREAGVCGQCHEEYQEWEKSNHSDGMAYGYYEIARPLLVECTKCHYARMFSETIRQAEQKGIPFHRVRYKKRAAKIGPLMPDFSRLPRKDETGLSCTACHDPHAGNTEDPLGIRVLPRGELCQTCHHEKWQNGILEGTAGSFGNGFEYPGEDYRLENPHNTEAKCILCHMVATSGARDEGGVRRIGGHTLRMRDAGSNGDLGGYGPRRDDPSKLRDTGETDDLLSLEACTKCHEGIDTFDLNGFQRCVYESWSELGDLLRAANGGVLPGFRPGDKCATCHRGGTVPFYEDPSLVLENAYTNYKLIRNDRSFGVHNPKYTTKLLEDSLERVKDYLQAQGLAEMSNNEDEAPDHDTSQY